MGEDGGTSADSRKALIGAVIAGRPFKPDRSELKPAKLPIDALLIRAIVLGLVKDDRGAPCRITPAGIEIHGATILGRMDLDKVIGQDGGSVAPIAFYDCHFDVGFSGAHGKFSRLSFRRCTFGDRGAHAAGERPLPTIELTDAHIDGDLDLEGIESEKLPADEKRQAKDGPWLWIKAVGARINGKIELSSSRLRAPPEAEGRLLCEEAMAGLNLTLADIKGDVRILCGARCEGGIRMRGAHIAGDLWLRGARVEAAKGAGADEDALFLQGVHVGGFLMMDGGWDRTGKTARFNRFRCTGNINLTSAEVGRSLSLKDAVVDGKLDAPDLVVRDDLVLGAALRGDIDLLDCEIAGSLYLAGLSVAPSAEELSLRNGTIGKTLSLVPGDANYTLISARRAELRSLPGVELIEGLWQHVSGGRASGSLLEEYRLVQSAFLRHRSRIWALDGRASVFERVIETVGHKVDEASAEEYLRLHCHWYYGDKGPFRLTSVSQPRAGNDPAAPSWVFDVVGYDGDILTNCSFTVIAERTGVKVRRGETCPQEEPERRIPRFSGGLLLHPPRRTPNEPRTLEQQWVAGPTLVETTTLVKQATKLKKFERLLRPHMRHRVLLGGLVNITNLSCDMLDDEAGRAWGGDFKRIAMEHFTYRRASWSSEAGTAEHPTDKRFRSWFGKNWVDWVWPLWLPWPLSWKRRAMHWEGWQSRRNWIYQQFVRDGDLPYEFRHKIKEGEYRPQPFEQAIKVARAEGRESYAINFEMLKHRIEWRLFNMRSRWWLGVVGFFVAYGWAWRHDGNPWLVGLALLATLAVMMWLSTLHRVLSHPFRWQWAHHSIMFLLFAAPAAFLFFADGWGSRPLHFAIALLIFAAIRPLSWSADLVLRAGFGYLRRPLRAIVALTVAFLIGWIGVDAAVQQDMFVVTAEPVATLVAPHAEHKEDELAQNATSNQLMGSENTAGDDRFIRDISCSLEISKPLYALDVLVPLVDLQEESRCEVRRLHRTSQRPPTADGIRSVSGLIADVPALTIRNRDFWAVMKALYAIAGWFIVSLALLTFTQVNRTNAEAFPEGRNR
jgi:hypothetical protein